MMSQIEWIYENKKLSEEEFIKSNGEGTENVYHLLKNAKEGNISITKVSNNPGYLCQGEVIKGWTPAFGEGIALWIDVDPINYYHTSTIDNINWEDNTFKTRNSTYKFEFNESKSKEIK